MFNSSRTSSFVIGFWVPTQAWIGPPSGLRMVSDNTGRDNRQVCYETMYMRWNTQNGWSIVVNFTILCLFLSQRSHESDHRRSLERSVIILDATTVCFVMKRRVSKYIWILSHGKTTFLSFHCHEFAFLIASWTNRYIYVTFMYLISLHYCYISLYRVVSWEGVRKVL